MRQLLTPTTFGLDDAQVTLVTPARLAPGILGAKSVTLVIVVAPPRPRLPGWQAFRGTGGTLAAGASWLSVARAYRSPNCAAAAAPRPLGLGVTLKEVAGTDADVKGLRH
jgi:hypothetical protein